ncbi:MAG: hypothetical protein RLP09_43530 [Sandaracinaceae bacterium]
MGERLDRALGLLERLVVATERIADRDARPAPKPAPRSPRRPLSPEDRKKVEESTQRRVKGLLAKSGR